MKFISLTVDNYLRVVLAEISAPAEGSGTVALMGANEQGKTSALDAFESAIAGRKAPKKSRPVHAGAEKATIVATFQEDTGETIVVERVYRADGGTSITVRQDGLKVARADDLLRRLYSHVALDPLAFANLSSKEQTDTLVRLTGFDPAPLDAERDNVFATRTDANREANRLQARLAAFPAEDAALADREPEDAAAIAADLQAALDTNREHEQHRIATDNARARLRQAREALAAAEARVEQEAAEVAAAERTVDTDGDDVDVAPLRARLEAVGATNDGIRVQQDRREVAALLADAKDESAALTDRLDDIARRKADGFAGVTMPVPGLTIEDGEVHLDGTPFSQTSSGRKLRTSAAIAMALAPDLRVILIRDGSLLDEDNVAAIDELAHEHDFVVLMETVDQGAGAGVVFEDGRTREVGA